MKSSKKLLLGLSIIVNTSITLGTQFNLLPKEIKSLILMKTVSTAKDFKELIKIYDSVPLINKELSGIFSSFIETPQCKEFKKIYLSLKDQKLDIQNTIERLLYPYAIKRYMKVGKNSIPFTTLNLIQKLYEGKSDKEISIITIKKGSGLLSYGSRYTSGRPLHLYLLENNEIPEETRKNLQKLVNLFSTTTDLKQ